MSYWRMLRRARWALATTFFVNGAVVASWVPHIPAIKSCHALTDGQLGLVLLATAAGSVLALPVAGRLVGRFGSRSMTAVAGLALCLALPLPILSPDVIVLSLCLGLLGACNGALDVSMNANALIVERHYGRPIMSSFHAPWSLGGVGGAAIAGAVMWLGVGDAAHVVGASAVSTSVAAVAARRLLPSDAERGPGAAFGRPTRALLVLGAVAFCGLLAEGAIGDWSAVYLHDALASGPSVAALGFGAFALAMTVGRLTGDRLVERLGAGATLRASGVVAAAGLGAALLIDAAPAAVVELRSGGAGDRERRPPCSSDGWKDRRLRRGLGPRGDRDTRILRLPLRTTVDRARRRAARPPRGAGDRVRGVRADRGGGRPDARHTNPLPLDSGARAKDSGIPSQPIAVRMMEVMTVLTAIVPLLLLTVLVALPLGWRIRADRRRERADLLSADIRSAINRRLRGESLLTVEVTPGTLWRPGRVVLWTPAGYENLVETIWRDVLDRLPRGYDLVVRPGHAADPAPMQRAA